MVDRTSGAGAEYRQIAVVLLKLTILYRINKAKLLVSAKLPQLARYKRLRVGRLDFRHYIALSVNIEKLF